MSAFLLIYRFLKASIEAEITSTTIFIHTCLGAMMYAQASELWICNNGHWWIENARSPWLFHD